MEIRITPAPDNPLFLNNPKIAVILEPEARLGVFYEEGAAIPDRHFLIGLAQIALFGIEENDPDYVEFSDQTDLEILRNGKKIFSKPDLLIVQSVDGVVRVLAVGNASEAKKKARLLIKILTGHIRLDVP